jgi:hypothetical protein
MSTDMRDSEAENITVIQCTIIVDMRKIVHIIKGLKQDIDFKKFEARLIRAGLPEKFR